MKCEDSSCRQVAPAGGIFRKYPHRTVCRETPKAGSEHETRAVDIFGKYNDTKVCREITKIDSDTQGIPSDSCTYNTASRCNLVNQRNFNHFMLFSQGWGLRGSPQSKVNKTLIFDTSYTNTS